MNIAIILSGGVGSRFGGDTPKQYLKVNGRMIIEYSLDVIVRNEDIDKLVIVADNEWRDVINAIYKDNLEFNTKLMGYADPGATRQLSIYNALMVVGRREASTVFIHDSARPYLTGDMIHSYIGALGDHDGVLPVLPVKDSVYISSDGRNIDKAADRSILYRGQAPEVFRLNEYINANEALMPEEILNITGSAAAALSYGLDVIMVPGEERNIKITTRDDYECFASSVCKG